jgi:hypothetical protein
MLLYLRAIRRLLRSGRPSFGRLDDRMVFVFGSPRSGTTFLAGAIGSLPRFVDLGEVNPLKAAIPELEELGDAPAAARIRHIVDRVRRFGLAGSRRAVEQTPEVAFVLRAVALAYPQATLVHALRDGRDVACSLLEQGWLNVGRAGTDDAGAVYGPHPRRWVEPGREEEFRATTDARRAAWAWRRYVSAVRESGVPVVEVRYERMASDPDGPAAELARALSAPMDPLAEALAAAHGSSVGRWHGDLTPEQLADVEAEAGPLLAELGYAGTEASLRGQPA